MKTLKILLVAALNMLISTFAFAQEKVLNLETLARF